MAHAIRPYEEQKNIPTLNDEPFPTAIELRFPESFSTRAWHMIEELGDTILLYMHNNRFVVTDESCALDNPRWTGYSLDELETWLEGQAVIKDKEEPGWEDAFLVSAEQPDKGTQRSVLAVSFGDALRIARARGFREFEFSCGGLHNDISEYLRENACDLNNDGDEDYAIFADVIVRLGDAWGREADVSRLLY